MKITLALLAFLSIVGALPAYADQNDPRLDALFTELRAETDLGKAQTIEDNIWLVWMQSGDSSIDQLFTRGRQALLSNDIETAVTYSTRVVRQAPNFAEGWYMCSTILYRIGDMELALRYAKKALALEPRHFPALMGIGVIHMQQHADEEAVAALRQALEVDPHLVQAQAIMDELVARAGKKDSLDSH